jgi:type I restriction enzyme, S subunit
MTSAENVLYGAVTSEPLRIRRLPSYSACRPSRARWLGDIPEHWNTRKLKFLASIRNSNVDKKSHDDERKVELCNYVDVYYNEYITDSIDFMHATASIDEIRRFSLRKGDVLITKDSETWDDIAVPAFVDQTLDNVLCGYHLAQIRPKVDLLDGEYLFRAFASHAIRDQFRVAANGITRFGLSRDDISGAVFPVPPLEEQQNIAMFLRSETGRIDGLVAGLTADTSSGGLVTQLVRLLSEQREAIVSAAVTGKIDVRQLAGKGTVCCP